MKLARRDRVRDLCETYGAAWVESPPEMLRRMTPKQRARLAAMRDEQSYLLARGEPSPRLDPALARADEIDDEMERRVACTLAARRLGRRALGIGLGAPGSPAAAGNVLSLCSGIGGLDLGLAIATQTRVVCYVEIDRRCQDTLLARMADGVLDWAPIWDDLKQFDAGRYRGRVDTVVGGYPCPPFSHAGPRRGADDPRYLWPDFARIVGECEPEWCLFENVGGHLSLGASDVVRDLVGMGYRVALGLFTAAELGAPHGRERLFILAHSDARGLHDRAAEHGRESNAEGRGGGVRGEDERQVAVVGRAAVGDPGPPAEAGRPGRRPVPQLSGPGAWRRRWGYPCLWPPRRRDSWQAWRGVRALDPSLLPGVDRQLNAEFVEWAMGLPRGWTEGLSWEARGTALGNAVVPAVAALAWAELTAAREE